MTSPEHGLRPTGLFRLVVINCFLMLLGIAFAWHHWGDPITRWFILCGVLVWMVLGPVLLTGHPRIWLHARRLAYGYAMILSLFAFMLLIKGMLTTWPWAFATALIFVVYLIGLRGYLNTERVRRYFNVAADAPRSRGQKKASSEP